MKLLITGGSGFLGSHLLTLAKEQHETFATFFSRPFDGGLPLDMRDDDAVKHLFAEVKPDCVIHTAYDKARRAVIVMGTANIAAAAQAHGARLVHLSTDVVFSGARGSYREDDALDPVTEYGQMKADAERVVMAHAPDALMVRTSLIYGTAADDERDAHVRLIVDGLRERHPVTLFTDEYRCPICVDDLARALLELVSSTSPPTPLLVGEGSGPLHIVGAERVSRYEFGVLIARYHGLDPSPLVATTSEALGMVRPKDCSLNMDKARALLRTRLRGVSEVLRR